MVPSAQIYGGRYEGRPGSIKSSLNGGDHGTVKADGDGLSDGVEINTYKSNPLLTDTDGDSMSDSEEVAEGLSPTDDSDCPNWYCPKLSPAVIEAATQ